MEKSSPAVIVVATAKNYARMNCQYANLQKDAIQKGIILFM